MKKEATKLLIETDPQDTLILARLSTLLEVPKSVVYRWAIRYFALHSPLANRTETGRAYVLEGITTLNTGFGTMEETGWQAKRNDPQSEKSSPKLPPKGTVKLTGRNPRTRKQPPDASNQQSTMES